MKRILIAAAAFAAMAGAAMAQPAYDSSQGSPPDNYPPCTHKGQDRCVSGGHARHMAGHHKASKAKGGESGGGKSSTDGERG
jgi:hypothetical protein